MITVDNIHTYGWIDAIRGMRNPLNSWNKIDSTSECDPSDGHTVKISIGPNDEKLIRALTIGGEPHRKFLRQISVSMDITAPAYWWAEMDTYKVGTTRNSCSVQHKGASRDFTEDDFTIDGVCSYAHNKSRIRLTEIAEADDDIKSIVLILNKWRARYAESKAKNEELYDYFRIMRQLMPMGYNYKATWTGNYEILLNIYKWRHDHKLMEWRDFCDSISRNAPYFANLIEQKL